MFKSGLLRQMTTTNESLRPLPPVTFQHGLSPSSPAQPDSSRATWSRSPPPHLPLAAWPAPAWLPGPQKWDQPLITPRSHLTQPLSSIGAGAHTRPSPVLPSSLQHHVLLLSSSPCSSSSAPVPPLPAPVLGASALSTQHSALR